MLLRIHPVDPQPRLIREAARILNDGGVIIYPTDTIYGLGCDIFQHKAVERICKIKGIDPKKAQLSFICRDLSHLSDYTRSINTPLYRMLKTYLPGPFTFILPASRQVPKIVKSKKDTIGLRIPDNKICMSLLEEIDRPLLSTTLPGEMIEDFTDPELIHEHFEHLVDAVIDGGIGGFTPSTVVDCTSDDWQILREGAGKWEG
ncbi:MAG: threonylcarbamoyl-AMP synthase [Chitinophagaceae bacterium]|nr:threonylcarbamoyl-AMP synthase [Chitinophagaceae bacterium]